MKRIILFILMCALKVNAQDNKSVSENFTVNGQYLREAVTDIASASEIANKASVTFVAGNSILLTGGFCATAGSTFKGYIDVNSTEIKLEPKAKMQLTMAPNPSADVMTIDVKDDLIARIVLVAMDGKTVLDKETGNQNSYLLDVSHFPKGVYLLTIETISGNTNTEKIIIQ